MIIGFSRYGSGGSGPVLDYLTGYLVSGGARSVKPEVVRGDPTAVAEIIDALPFERRYSSGVLSFATEDLVTPEIQEDIMNRFERAVFAGLPSDRRSIVWIKHADKGRTELHFVVAKVDLATGKSLNIAPPTPASRHLLDTLRESINRRYGFGDPSDPDRTQAVSVPAYIAKLSAQAKRLGHSPKTDIRQAITKQLEEKVVAGAIKNRADVVNSLIEQGFSISRAGINYVTIVRPDSGERVRLKGNIFREHFSPRDLELAPRRSDPARLLALDRRLDGLVQKRASYHRARYGVNESATDRQQVKQGVTYDRIGNPIAHSSSAHGKVTLRQGAPTSSDSLRLNEAVQHLRCATDELERASERLDQTDRAFACDFEQAVVGIENGRQVEELDQHYQEEIWQRRDQDLGMELELEL